MYRRDISKALFASAAGATLFASRAQSQTCAAPCYPITPAETAANVTPVNLNYPPGHLYRFGTNANPGMTDMTAAANTWAKVAGQLSIPVPDQVLVTGPIDLKSNTVLTLDPGATIIRKTAALAGHEYSLLQATSKTNIVIQGGKLQIDTPLGPGADSRVGLVRLVSCTYCTVRNVECIGAQWAGISLAYCEHCLIEGNYIHDSLGTSSYNDNADISLYDGCSWNVIANNHCCGGALAQHGIAMINTDSAVLQTRNTVYGNIVTEHGVYGIVHYLTIHANTYCTIENNLVQDIDGTDPLRNGGCGIYNQGAGGTLISNNTVRNCCRSTNSMGSSLTPAGIGLNLDPAFEAVNVTGNGIYDMAQFYGIEVVGGPANVSGNTVQFAATSRANTGIYVYDASNVNLTGNHITIDTSITNGHGIFVLTKSSNLANISVTDNYVRGCSLRQIRVDTSGTPMTTNVVINGNNMSGGGASCIPLHLGNVAIGSVTGNVAAAGAATALVVQSSPQVRYANNLFSSTGAVSVSTSGNCTGSYFDKSNLWTGQLQNAATGMICEQLANASPAAGNISAVGDRIEQSSPSIGTPKGWRCTGAGNPGNWVSEGNL
jgi:hypothetical protein